MAKTILTRSEFGALQSEFYSLQKRLKRAQSDAEKDKILDSMRNIWREAQSLIHSPKVPPRKLAVSSEAAQFLLE